MLTNDVRFEGFTSRDWERFLALWKPRAAPTREASRRRGGLLVVHDGLVVRKIIHSERGRRVPGQPWPVDPAALARAEGASWVFMAKDGAIEALMDRWAERTKRGDDLTAQLLTLASIGEELLAEGRLELWPHRLAALRVPTEAMVHKALDIVCPDGKSLLLGVFHDGDLDTSILDELPPGRQSIATKRIRAHERERAYKHIRREVGNGRRVQKFVLQPR